MRTAKPALLTALAAAVLLGAGSVQGASAPHSGVRGSVTLGPTCPVETTPPDPSCADLPYDAQVRAVRRGHTVARTRSGDDGRFRLRLVPGVYTLVVKGTPVGYGMLPGGDGGPAPCPSKRVRVRRNRYAAVTIRCDSGIR